MPSLFRLRVLKLFLACIRISYHDKSATHTTPRRTVFTQRLVSGHLYEVNMAITSGSPFLSIRKSKYQRDMASKMKQLCCLIRTSHSSRSLGGTGYFLRWNQRGEFEHQLYATISSNNSNTGDDKFNEQFQILPLELKVKFIWIAFVCISDGFRFTCLIYIGYASCWQVPQNGGQTWRLPKIR